MTGAALSRLGDGRPSLVTTLSLAMQLTHLTPDHAEGLQKIVELAADWIGAELKWTSLSCWEDSLPFDPAQLAYIPTYAASLVTATVDDVYSRMVLNQIVSAVRTDYSVAIKGGATEEEASPFQLEFWSEIPTVPVEGPLEVKSTLRVCVPPEWPLDDFLRRVDQLVRCLPVRWANAGLGYSYWDMGEDEEVFRALWAHARRFHGFDVPMHVRNLEAFHHRARSVSWLTYVGGDLAQQVRASQEPWNDRLVQVADDGAMIAVRAGGTPQPCDINRLAV